MEWFRSYHGAPTDPKWRTVSKRSETQPGVSAAIWWALMDFASQHNPRGSIEGFDAEVLADAYGFDQALVDYAAAPDDDRAPATEDVEDGPTVAEWIVDEWMAKLLAHFEECESVLAADIAIARAGDAAIRKAVSELAAALRAEHERARKAEEALAEIVNPLPVLERRAKADGCVLNGNVVALVESVSYLRDIARRALAARAALPTGDDGRTG